MLIRLILFCLMVLATAPAAAQTPGPPSPALAIAWQRVTQAQSWSQQAYEVNAFVRTAASEGHRPGDLTLDARDIASGRVVPTDDPALLQRPQAHEVTITLDDRFYVFRPLSRASIEPLLPR